MKSLERMDDSDGLVQLTELRPTVCQRGAYLHIALCTELTMHVVLAPFKKLMNQKPCTGTGQLN